MNHNFDVLIIGGGVIGLAAAIAMAVRNYSVAVLDSGSFEAGQLASSRVYAINKASRDLLTQLNVWKHLDLSKLSIYDKMYVWDGLSGANINFDSRIIASSNLGYIIEESILKQALIQQINVGLNIKLFPHVTAELLNISEQNVKLSANNTNWRGRLLMVADGAVSKTREQLNIALTTWSYEQNALVGSVVTEYPHKNTAYQVFNPSGPLAFLPLRDSNECSIVWSNDLKQTKYILSLDKESLESHLATSFQHRLGKVSLISNLSQYPLHMRHVQSYVGKRWLLLGDCAHTIHPLAGLGLNLGLSDVCSWLNCLDNSTQLASLRALNAYQRERKNAVWQTILLMEGFKQIFASSFKPISFMRSLGLNICNNSAILKRLFIQYAAGA